MTPVMKRARFLADYLLFKAGQHVVNKHYIFELRDPARLDRRSFPDETILFLRSFAEMPPDVRADIVASEGQAYLDDIAQVFETERSALCLAMVGREFAGVSWMLSGAVMPDWHLPLQPADHVVYRGLTKKKFRGRGLYARCIATSYDAISAEGGRFLADVHVLNKPSTRQFLRTGFDIIDCKDFSKAAPDR